MQCESFLEYQKQLNGQKGRDNTQALFDASKIHTDSQIRNTIDPTKAETLFESIRAYLSNIKDKRILRTI